MDNTKEFDFILDTKMMVWNRQKFSIQAATLEDAKQKAIELIKNGEEIDFYSGDYMYDTEEHMTPEQNNGEPTTTLIHLSNEDTFVKNIN